LFRKREIIVTERLALESKLDRFRVLRRIKRMNKRLEAEMGRPVADSHEHTVGSDSLCPQHIRCNQRRNRRDEIARVLETITVSVHGKKFLTKYVMSFSLSKS